MLNDFEQRVYNCYLATSRSLLNKPFTLRKDFSNFTESDDNYIYVKRVAFFLRKFPHIDMKEYFSAPYEIYKDGQLYDLKFFATQKGISVYSMYHKKLQNQSPDTEEQIIQIKKSLSFILKFCLHNKIKLTDYIHYKLPECTIEAFVDHYRSGNINIYVLMRLPGFDKYVSSMHNDIELKALFFGDFIETITRFKIKLHQSTTAKKLIDGTINKALLLV